MSEFITVETQDEITMLTLHRPEVLNAIHEGLRREVIAALAEFNADDGQRAMVMTGAGDRAFTTGQDLREAMELDAGNTAEWQEQLRGYLGAIRDLDKPLVAALNGVAAGAGFYTALLCDMRIGHPGIKMGQPELNVGFPSVVGTRLMYLTLGHAATVDLTLTGRLVDGEEALRLGLVHELVPRERVMDRSLELARELGGKPPVAMKLTKQALREFTQDVFDGAIDTGKELQPLAYASGEPQRVIAEFLARKK